MNTNKLKKIILYLAILILPFAIMVGVNETVRFYKTDKGYLRQGVTAINSVTRTPDTCTWICHNDTSYCKEQHVKYAKPYFSIIDPIYFGIIRSLHATGNYGLANIVFLVIVFPLALYFLFIKSLHLQSKINRLKNK